MLRCSTRLRQGGLPTRQNVRPGARPHGLFPRGGAAESLADGVEAMPAGFTFAARRLVGTPNRRASRARP